MRTLQIVRDFVSLESEAKAQFIDSLSQRGVHAKTIEEFKWLASLSPEQVDVTSFEEMYPN